MRFVLVAAALLVPRVASADETIEDPLASKAPSAPIEKPSELHVDLYQRTTVDTHWSTDPIAPALAEDVLRSWLRTTLSASGGTKIRYRLDVRLDLEARAKRGLERPTYLYDAIPLTAFVDVPVGEKVRLKVGEQMVSWGKMDLASAADVLDRRDLRAGPVVDAAWTRLPTPTIRADYHGRIDLSLAWSVISRPHRFELAGSSWSVLGPGLLGSVNGRDTLQRIATSTDASTFIRVQDAFLQASTSTPRLDGGDLATRATAHLGGADLALTYGYARTKLPIITFDQSLIDVVAQGDLPSALSLVRALEEGRPLVRTSYPRVHQLALDLEGAAGPLVLSWELGFSPNRPLYVLDANGIPARADTGLGQAGVRAQYTRGETFALVGEVDYFVATRSPGRDPYLVLGPRRSLLAAVLSFREVLRRKHTIEGAALFTTSGSSLALSARYGYELSDTWTLGFGGALFPGVGGASRPKEITVADVQVGRDFVEVFVRARR